MQKLKVLINEKGEKYLMLFGRIFDYPKTVKGKHPKITLRGVEYEVVDEIVPSIEIAGEAIQKAPKEKKSKRKIKVEVKKS